MKLIKITATGDTSQPFCPRAGSAPDSAAERARQYLFSNPADGCHLGFAGRLAAYDNPAFSWCELTVVIAGELRITDAAGRVTLAGPGEAVAISRGARCTIDQSRLDKRLFVGIDGPPNEPAPQAAIVKIDPLSPMSECVFALPAELLSSKGAPVSRVQTSFEDAGIAFSAGLWGCTPYTRLPITTSRNEFMQLLSGSCTLTETGGVPVTIDAGDMVFIPRNAVFDWHSPVDVVKLYGSHR